MQTKDIVRIAPQTPIHFGLRVGVNCDSYGFLLTNEARFNLGLAHVRQPCASCS